jgi:glycosyltransferase involved in cell wall biosynthesis
MQVAYDAAPLMNPRTGVGHYAATLLDRLMKLDTELQFMLYALTRSNDTSGVPSGDRISFKHWRLPARVVTRAWERLGFPAGERLIGRPDIVHGTNFWIPPVKNVKGVVTIHDLTFHLHPEFCTPQIQRYEWMIPKVLERCSIVLVPSQTVGDELHRELGFPQDRIIVTPEGVREAFVGAAPDPALQQRMGIRGDYILFAGTQEPRKNLDRLLQALSKVDPNLSLVIAGPPGWGSIDLPALSHKLKLDRRVIFSNYIPDQALGSLLAGARAFVFPTLYEGFGLPPLEAMAAGVPVVAARAGALPEVLGDAPIWCDPLDAASIANAIDIAVSDEALRKQSVQLGRARARMFDWNNTARLTLEAYRKALSG